MSFLYDLNSGFHSKNIYDMKINDDLRAIILQEKLGARHVCITGYLSVIHYTTEFKSFSFFE